MTPTIRDATAADVDACARIVFDAFSTISRAHGFPPDFPDVDRARGMVVMMVAHPAVHFAVAERDGTIVGCVGNDERGPIAGVGPVTVAPVAQNAGVGRVLVEHVLARSAARGLAGVRLVQAAFHNRSLSLYTKLGFDPREPLSCTSGAALGLTVEGHRVRPAVEADVPACRAVCVRVHGHDRDGELRDAIASGAAMVVEHDGRVTGYTTGVAFFGHTVGETDEDVKALIGAAPAFGGPGFLLPTRNAALLRWCLAHGLRVVQPMTLMSVGLYNEPRGAFLAAISF